MQRPIVKAVLELRARIEKERVRRVLKTVDKKKLLTLEQEKKRELNRLQKERQTLEKQVPTLLSVKMTNSFTDKFIQKGVTLPYYLILPYSFRADCLQYRVQFGRFQSPT